MPGDERTAVLAAADRLMAGHAEFFGVTRSDMARPDWFRDPKTGRRAPDDTYAFDVAYRDEEAVGDIKQIWEPSRHQYLTVLAAAYHLTGDDAYAQRVSRHLRSWWAANPPMRGPHWISGIELGIRLISWVWVRRLLAGWSEVADLFDANPEAAHQIRTHQRWLAAFPSYGSSANNHAVAECAGQLAAACAFPWFPESARWRSTALSGLEQHLCRNTFPSGLNREQASEYHGLVLELGLVAVAEASAAGVPVPDAILDVLARMTDALAGIVDGNLCPPRQGDGDDGHGLVLGGSGDPLGVTAVHRGRTVRRRTVVARPAARGHPDPCPGGTVRPGHSRAEPADEPARELRRRRAHLLRRRRTVWCRCDGGPHGFGTIAAHAHADALADRGAPRTEWRSSPIPGRTATTANRSGGATSAPLGGTTRWSWTEPTSRRPAGPSCGPGTPAAG